MANRDNHYELAFEALLRDRRIPYVAVNEQRRSLFGGDSLKSLDFIVSPPGRAGPLLIDVKGRRFPSAGGQYWNNWSTLDDVRSLARWRPLFGPRATATLVFGFWLCRDQAPLPSAELFTFKARTYGFVAIELEKYLGGARTLSPKWSTIAMPGAEFRRRAVSFPRLVEEAKPAAPPADAA